MRTKLYRSRTLWLAAAMAAVGVLQTQIDVFGEFLTPRWQGVTTLAVGIAFAVLRVLTTGPVGGDEK